MERKFGSIFGESIHYGAKKFSKYKTAGSPKTLWLLMGFLVILIAFIGLLVTRLVELNIIEGSYYQKLSYGNRIREKKLVAPRGIIYDRNGVPLVHNIPKGANDVTREYPYSSVFAHVLGYMGEIDSADLNSLNSSLPDSLSYKLGDHIGKSGIEEYYESRLRGIDGKELVEVDARGNAIRDLGRIEPKVGSNIKLSLDLDLQKIASSSMVGRRGAVVATVPATGEVLALYSSPSFDPNNFIEGKNLGTILNDGNLPLFDRAVGGIYPPGSTFKIITSIAGLETGAITPQTQIEDTGVIQIGSFSFANWYFSQYGKKEGMVNIVKAIKRSNDIFFYKTGEAIGIERLSEWAKKLGVGSLTGIDLPGEAKGLMPDGNWKKKVKGEDWYLGDTYHLAIGQGDLEVTPLQDNAWTNIVGNGGKLCRPHLLLGQKVSCKELGIRKETIDLIKEGMKEACSIGGTGWPFFDFKVANPKLKPDGLDFMETYESTTSAKKSVGIPVACKTGTSEYGDPAGRTHAIFTVFAPVYHPQISITVVVEGGGEGSSVAAPIAKDMLTEWFSK